MTCEVRWEGSGERKIETERCGCGEAARRCKWLMADCILTLIRSERLHDTLAAADAIPSRVTLTGWERPWTRPHWKTSRDHECYTPTRHEGQQLLLGGGCWFGLCGDFWLCLLISITFAIFHLSETVQIKQRYCPGFDSLVSLHLDASWKASGWISSYARWITCVRQGWHRAVLTGECIQQRLLYRIPLNMPAKTLHNAYQIQSQLSWHSSPSPSACKMAARNKCPKEPGRRITTSGNLRWISTINASYTIANIIKAAD